MTSAEINYVSKQLFTAIKDTLNEDRTKYPNKVHPYVSVGIYNMGKWLNDIGYSIQVCGCEDGFHSKVTKIKTKENTTRWYNITNEDKDAIKNKVVELLKELKTKRGWDSLAWENEDNKWQGGSNLGFIKCVTLTAPPCKEWESLKNYLAKYCNKVVGDKDIWSVRIGGKRGIIYGEEGDRYYLCNMPCRCREYLETLRKTRGSKDKVSCSFRKYDDIDRWELQSSIRNEVEFGGARINCLDVVITSPSGKVKGKFELR